MAKARKATANDWNMMGIHLVAPTKAQIEAAKEEADSKDFAWVWIHRKGSSKVITKRMICKTK